MLSMVQSTVKSSERSRAAISCLKTANSLKRGRANFEIDYKCPYKTRKLTDMRFSALLAAAGFGAVCSFPFWNCLNFLLLPPMDPKPIPSISAYISSMIVVSKRGPPSCRLQKLTLSMNFPSRLAGTLSAFATSGDIIHL